MHLTSSVKACVFLSAFLLVLRGILLLPLASSELSLLTKALCSIDSETRLACGESIPFEEADLYTLELLPGLGQKVIWNIYMYQNEVQLHYCLTGDPIEALTLVPSVGKKTAQKLLRYVTFENVLCR